MRSVLFVCLGNICRSPAAEGVMLDVVDNAGLSDAVQVDSAGTGGWHVGNMADSRMRAAANRRGYDLQSRARQVTADDIEQFDLVIAMDQSNLENLKRLAVGRADNIHMLGEYLDADNPPDVPDPYYGGESGFDQVLDMIERACPEILKTLMES
ncbi:MAG TPA: protein tyrosine phosphatase [Phycisphaerales bacterium]|nr:protein tyrosine phosphatase [Phycisphaerales bacterium]HCD31301.1 protein tyrosine phosphatase [Phycisphaerales bacterium]